VKRAPVKSVLFKVLEAIQPGLAKGAHACYVAERDTIYIDKGLPRLAVPGKGMVLAHERGHELAWKHGIEPLFTGANLEAFCDFYALAFAPKNSLTGLELLCREFVFPGHARATRIKLIATCLDLAGVKDKATALKRIKGEA
jgi:hypothetical protein